MHVSRRLARAEVWQKTARSPSEALPQALRCRRRQKWGDRARIALAAKPLVCEPHSSCDFAIVIDRGRPSASAKAWLSSCCQFPTHSEIGLGPRGVMNVLAPEVRPCLARRESNLAETVPILIKRGTKYASFGQSRRGLGQHIVILCPNSALPTSPPHQAIAQCVACHRHPHGSTMYVWHLENWSGLRCGTAVD